MGTKKFSKNSHLKKLTLLIVLFQNCASAVELSDQTIGPSAELGAQLWTTSGNSDSDSWNYWWSYSGVSGPKYWGLLNPDWQLCDKGRRQSPVNINTRSLIYDPQLKPLKLDSDLISGVMHNDGHSIVFNGSLAAAYKSLLLLQTSNSNQSQALAGNSNILLFADKSVAQKDSNDQNAESRVKVRKRRKFGGNGKADMDSSGGIEDLVENIDLSVEQSDRLASSSLDLPEFGGRVLFKRDSPTDSYNHQDDDDDDDNHNHNNRVESSASLVSTLQQQQLEEQIQALETKSVAKFSGAGLSYSYQFETMHLRFGLNDQIDRDESHQTEEYERDHLAGGSEHRIDGRAFAGELQLLAYNWQLYKDFQEAALRPNGLLGISVLILRSEDRKPTSNTNGQDNQNSSYTTGSGNQFESLIDKAAKLLKFRGQFVHLAEFRLHDLLPQHYFDQFVTYEGSLSWPGCHESVTWILLNKPLYLSRQSLDTLRTLSADERSQDQVSGTLIGGNIRPIQELNGRQLRTNIKPASTKSPDQETCSRLWTKYRYNRASE